MDFKFPLEVKLVPSQYTGPLPSGLVGLILPRSSAHKLGCFVVPGVIDSDYTGTLLMQIWVNLPQLLPKGSSVAQLLFLPYKVPNPGTGHRGNSGFGSTLTSVGLLQSINSFRPLLTLYLNKQPFQGLLDTGADVTVISLLQWPVQWPKRGVNSLWGIGGSTTAWQSVHPIAITTSAGKSVSLHPYILDIHTNIWGRDLLSLFNAHLILDDGTSS